MATPKDIPSRVNLSALDVSGDILITGILAPADVIIDGGDAISFTAPLNFDSPIACKSFSAPMGTVAYINYTPNNAWTPLDVKSQLIAWYDFSDESTITYTEGIGGVTAVADKAPTDANPAKVLAYNLNGAVGHGSGGGVPPTYGDSASTHNGLKVMDFTGKSKLDVGVGAHTDADEIMVVHDAAATGNLLVTFVAGLKRPHNTYGTTGMGTSSLVSMVDGYIVNSSNAGTAQGKGWQLEHALQPAGMNNEATGGSTDPSRIFNGSLKGKGNATGADGPKIEMGVWTVLFDFTNVTGGGQKKHLYFNGASSGTTDPAPYSTASKLLANQRLMINSNRTDAAWPNSSHAEMIISFDVGLREVAEGYLAHKWGLAGDLDAGHAYKSVAPASS